MNAASMMTKAVVIINLMRQNGRCRTKPFIIIIIHAMTYIQNKHTQHTID